MAQTVGRNTNRNDTAVLSDPIELNAVTSAKIADAKPVGSVPARTVFMVSNPSNENIWIKLQAAAVDNDKKGIYIPRGGYWEMTPDNIYTGEISAIAESETPNIYVTEY